MIKAEPYMNVRSYSGDARPVSSLFEGKFPPVEWNHADGSLFRGYLTDTGYLVCGSCITVSSQRQAALDASNAAVDAEIQERVNQMARMDTLRSNAGNRNLNPTEVTEALGILIGHIRK